ncbi:MAG TPA: AMIN domain-containing protein [Longimicrobiales bacterium]|nr:AMIN domain-containing protein [Longimicrobiales bacterium]
MTALIALLLAVFGAEPRVTGISVTPSADRTEVVILVDGAVTPTHMMLEDGRLVVDLTGVPQAPRMEFRDVNRGGVIEVRVGQFQPNVARVVIALAGRVQYDVTREDGRVRVTFPNRTGSFEPWNRTLGNAQPSGVMPAPADAAPPRAVNLPALQQTPQQPQQQRIRIEFDQRPITEVLAVFSDLSGRTIMPSPGVRTKLISADLRDVPWPDALAAILEANDMTIREVAGGILLVEDASVVAERELMEPIVTESFTIQYISADSIRLALQGLLTEAGSVNVNRSSNSIIVTDVISSVQRLRAILPQLDTKTPQVDISATIAFIDRTTLESMGIVYDVKDSRGNQLNRLVGGFRDANRDGVLQDDEATDDDVVLLGGKSIAALGNANFRVASPSIELISTLVLGRHSLITFLEALQTVSMSDIQAKPLVRTMDHRLATIQVGEETPIRIIDAGATGGGQAPRATVEMKSTGIILEVTPHITGNQVLLDLRAERSNVGAAPSDVGVIFQTQNARTQVLVNDGETIVIGGLTIIEKTKSRAGIPLLMDLPVIGALFRNETERENKRDLLIMVRAHIVRE